MHAAVARLAPPATRARGRPARSADRDAREALLDAAVALFAERGVVATSSVDIASRAGVTPAMIHYYFRGRAKLIDAVVDERIARFVARVFAPPADRSAPALATLPALVGRIFDAAREMPWMPPIWIREIAAEGGALRERALRWPPVAAVTAIGAIGDALAGARRRGEIAPGIDPRLVFVSIMGLTMFPLATREVWRRLPGAERVAAGDLERHAVAMLAGGLSGHLPPPRKPARRSRR